MAVKTNPPTSHEPTTKRKTPQTHWLALGYDASLTQVSVKLEALTRGLVIVGQSGCGKSFLLGRLIEEILRVSTAKTRVLVIDPNSDFCYGSLLRDWAGEFDPGLESIFERDEVDTTGKRFNAFKKDEKKYYAQLGRKLNLETSFVFGRDGDFLFSWEPVIRSIWRYIRIIKGGKCSPDYQWALTLLINALPIERRFCPRLAHLSIIDLLKQPSDPPDWMTATAHNWWMWRKQLVPQEALVEILVDTLAEEGSGRWPRPSLSAEAIAVCQKCSAENPLPCLKEAGLPPLLPGKLFENKRRFAVLDLEQIQDRSWRTEALLYLLTEYMRDCRQEVELVRTAKRENPQTALTLEKKLGRTFIVVDEAHVFAPAKPSTAHERTLGNILYSVASEGRKYGLHLILATQRPNKVKEGLLGECDNAIVLKMNSKDDLAFLASQMRILASSSLETCLHFTGVGNAIAVGDMTGLAPNVQQFLVSPRRTAEGGVDIKNY